MGFVRFQPVLGGNSRACFLVPPSATLILCLDPGWGTLNLIPTRSTTSEICTGCESSRRTVHDSPMSRSIWCLCVITKISTPHPSTVNPAPLLPAPAQSRSQPVPCCLLSLSNCIVRKGKRRKSGTVRLPRYTCIYSSAKGAAAASLGLARFLDHAIQILSATPGVSHHGRSSF